MPFVLAHESTEVGVVGHYIVSGDRRWFCDGVANYVAMRVLAAEFGAEKAKQCYDLDAQLKLYAADAPRIDLERWPVVDDLKKANYAEDLNTADYAYATKVIADACGRYGDELLLKLFRAVGQTKKDEASMTTVYAAFTQLTGEDLRAYLPNAHHMIRGEAHRSAH